MEDLKFWIVVAECYESPTGRYDGDRWLKSCVDGQLYLTPEQADIVVDRCNKSPVHYKNAKILCITVSLKEIILYLMSKDTGFRAELIRERLKKDELS